MVDPRLEELIARHLDGSLTAQEAEEMNALLLEKEENRRHFVAAMDMEVALEEAHGRALPQTSLPPRSSVVPDDHNDTIPEAANAGSERRFRRWPILAAAAAILIAVLFPFGEGKDPVASSRGLAGEVRDLEGARVVFLDDSELQAVGFREGRPVYRQVSGHLRYEVAQGQSGLFVETPQGVLQDIGTVFEVDLRNPRGGALSVSDGAVAFHPARGGEAIRFAPDCGRFDLHADGAIAKVIERDGLVQLRPRGAQLWSLAEDRLALEVGDWVRSDVRGAHAALLRFGNGSELRLGPASLIEIAGANRVRLLQGEIELVPAEKTGFELVGADDEVRKVARRSVFRAQDRAVAALSADPTWLTAFKGDGLGDAMGVLMAQVDGRDVPLTIAYQKINVDIRDQIARTTVETSFRNQTRRESPLEGTFYFPLPAGASVSGFGMWIGDELVEGEIVEKARAREIYETLLREKLDPALLEWAGGNLFKARVFPIHSTKRIRLRYTQVLPRVGKSYRYHYPLRSELTRKRPLEQLEILVKLDSSRPLAEVSCPSHGVRLQKTERNANLEFTAQEITPERDFEVLISNEAAPEGLSFVPHRRGDDGYFMMLLSGPEAPRSDERGLQDEKRNPLDLILVADTSGSIGAAERKDAEHFVRALFSSLGASDKVQLATLDTELEWATPDPVVPKPEALAALSDFFAARRPLGWTDLEAGLEAALERARPGSTIVYLGDGHQVTEARSDSSGLLQRLRAKVPEGVTIASVAVGQRCDDLVLDGLARIGKGVSRRIGGTLDPQSVASALVRELATPRVTDLEFSFEGLSVAAVRPSRLHSLRAGEEAVILGRFDPREAVREGSFELKGRYQGRSFSRSLPLVIPDSDAGNSFIPRLWARKHLDHLLLQGGGPLVQRNIIALSERYQIITPYTSFLVLDSDQQRDRFGVKRRTRMRDGEEFFLEARNRTNFQTGRQALEDARKWKRELRESVLASLRDMGRALVRKWASPPVTRLWGGQGYAYGLDTHTMSRTRGMRDEAGPSGSLSADKAWLGSPNQEVFESELAQTPLPPSEATPVMSRERRAGRASRGYMDGFFGGERVANLSMERLPRLQEALGKSAKMRFLPEDAAVLRNVIPGISSPLRAPLAPPMPAEALKLLSDCDLTNAAAQQGVRISSTQRLLQGGELVEQAENRWLVGPSGWFLASRHFDDSGTDSWFFDGRRVRVDRSWRIGASRGALPGDERDYPEPVPHLFGSSLLRKLEGATFRSQRKVEDRAVLDFDLRTTTSSIEFKNGALVSITEKRHGRLEGISRYHYDGTPAAGRFPIRVDHHDADDVVIRSWNITAENFESPAAFAGAFSALRKENSKALIIAPNEAPKRLLQQRYEAAEAGVQDLWALFVIRANDREWEKAEQVLARLLESANNPLAEQRIRFALLLQRREGSRVVRELRSALKALAAQASPGDYSRALWILGSGASSLSADEQLQLLSEAEAVIERRRGERAREIIDSRRRSLLARLGRQSELLSLYAAALQKRPKDFSLRSAYARALLSSGRGEEALALVPRPQRSLGWLAQGRHFRLRVDFLQELGRTQEALDETIAWINASPAGLESNDWKLSLQFLAHLGRTQELERLATQWLALSGAGDGEAVRRFEAAVDLIVAHGLGYRGRSFRDRWAAPLCDAVWQLRHEASLRDLGHRLVSDSFLRATTPGRALRGRLERELDEKLETWPFETIELQLALLHPGRNDGKAALQEQHPALDRLLARWKKERSEENDTHVASLARQNLSAPFLEKVFELFAASEGTRARRVSEEFAAVLFNQRLSELYTKEREPSALRAFAHASRLGAVPGEKPRQQIRTAVGRMLLLSDWISKGRARVLVDEKTRATSEAVGPRALKEIRKGFELQAQRETADLLRGLKVPGLEAWLRHEALALDTQGVEARQRAALATRNLESLRATLGDLVADASRWTPSQHHLAARASLVALASALQGGVPEEPSHQLLALAEERLGSPWVLLDARMLSFHALVATKDETLDDKLVSWFGGGANALDRRWGPLLARRQASRGEFSAAVATLRGLHEKTRLEASDYAVLADWHQALGQRKLSDEARRLGHEATAPGTLLDQLRSERYSRYTPQGNRPPEDIPESVPERFVSVLANSDNPYYGTRELGRYYRLTRDFRLLEALPRAAVGLSPGKVSQALRNASQLARSIPDEAALDRLAKGISDLRAGISESADARGLALVEFRLLLGGLNQIDGADSYEDRVIEALKTGTGGEWSPESAKALARFLAELPRQKRPALVALIRKSLRATVDACPDGSDDQLDCASYLARHLASHGDHEAAYDAMTRSLQAWRKRHGGLLDRRRISSFRTRIAYLNSLGRAIEGESLWREELARDYGFELRERLERMLFEHCSDAFGRSAATSHGEGTEQYRKIRAEMITALSDARRAGHAGMLVERLGRLHERAKKLSVEADVGADWAEICWRVVPPLLQRFHHHGVQNLIHHAGWRLYRFRGAVESLEFLVARAEATPKSTIWEGDDFWRGHGGSMSSKRRELGFKLPNRLAKRLLPIVLEEMRERLGMSGWRYHSIYDDSDADYWSAQSAAFRTTALELAQSREENESGVLSVARYLWRRHMERVAACDLLLAYHAQGRLTPNARHRMAEYLIQVPARVQTGILTLEGLIEESPKVLAYRLTLIRGHHHAKDPEAVKAALQRTRKELEQQKAWTAAAAASLAATCKEVALPEEAITLYRDALKRSRNESRAGSIGSWGLELARLLGGLGRSDEALDALAAAWTRGGHDRNFRRQLNAELIRILDACKDLDAFIAQVDQKADESGQENSVLRRELGRRLLKLERPADAVRQLRLSIGLGRPDDATRDLLVQALDASGHPEEADQVFLQAATQSGLESLELFVTLAKRLEKRGAKEQAERARTQLVEQHPLDSLSHERLAKLREERGELKRALEHWKRVDEIRPLEPTGVIEQIRLHERLEQKGRADKLRERLRKTSWPPRFDKEVKRALTGS